MRKPVTAANRIAATAEGCLSSTSASDVASAANSTLVRTLSRAVSVLRSNVGHRICVLRPQIPTFKGVERGPRERQYTVACHIGQTLNHSFNVSTFNIGDLMPSKVLVDVRRPRPVVGDCLGSHSPVSHAQRNMLVKVPVQRILDRRRLLALASAFQWISSAVANRVQFGGCPPTGICQGSLGRPPDGGSALTPARPVVNHISLLALWADLQSEALDAGIPLNIGFRPRVGVSNDPLCQIIHLKKSQQIVNTETIIMLPSSLSQETGSLNIEPSIQAFLSNKPMLG